VRREHPVSTSTYVRLGRAVANTRLRGWVLVTIMTAGIVAVLWQFAEPYLRDILERALEAVAP
jgi:hypothetical protein